jgi:formylglycine-generating enzyme required for sulfatase activity
LEWLLHPGRALRTIAAGSAYAGSDYCNAYNVVRVTFGAARSVKVWLRAFSPDSGCFVKDVATYADVEDGIWEWDLPGKVRSLAGRPAARRAAAPNPRRYFEKIREENRYIEIRGMGERVAEKMELREVYTRLRVAAPSREERRSAKARKAARKRKRARDVKRVMDEASRADLELRDLLTEHSNLVLVGDPGSGKTTFLRFVALNLVGATLGEDRKEAMGRIGFKGDPPFPVLVPLGRFGQFLREHPDVSTPPESPEHFYRYLDYSLRGYPFDLPEEYLRNRVLEGGCMLLMDGLDEVPGEEVRERVGRILEQVVMAGNGVGNRHLVTSRVRAYTGKVQLAGALTRCNLTDFGPAEVEAFVARWSRALHRLAPDEEGTAAADKASDYAQELLRAIGAHPDVAPMTANPLMLTVLAVVHWSRKKLPEQRAELYDAAVDYLVESRAKLAPIPNPLRKECLQAIALRMFEDPEGVRRTLGRAEAAEVIAPLLPGDWCEDRARVLEFLEEEELHSGILVSRMEGEVEFWHLTFQEYLAALELSARDGYWEEIEGHLFEDRWSEVVLLLAGCLRRLGIRKASQFLRRILAVDETLPGRARAVGLIGRILRDIGPYGGEPARGSGYAEALGETLAVFEEGAEAVSEATRVEVGEALGQAGDPRLADEAANRVFIKGGTFWMGSQKRDPKRPGYDPEAFDQEGPVHRVTVSDFEIDRFPVTVQQFRKFVEVGETGYLNPRVWDPTGWDWREKERRDRPGGWEEQLRHPNRPVVSVSWYEADAYARWAGKRLPTDAEWEYAARGDEGRLYPWGGEPPTNRHANFDMSVGARTPVGIYPVGATPEGIRDLAGNVWEWCQNWHGRGRGWEQVGPTGPDRGNVRQLRGGAFTNDRLLLRAACRYFRHPELENHFVGFRCVGAVRGQKK